jgi:hypothetical protein
MTLDLLLASNGPVGPAPLPDASAYVTWQRPPRSDRPGTGGSRGFTDVDVDADFNRRVTPPHTCMYTLPRLAGTSVRPDRR